MKYITSAVVTILLCTIQSAFCHLKDMGEITNWNAKLKKIESRIVGGIQASLDQFPFNVQFLNFGGMCGGSIITSKTVLTAAHCFDFNTNVADMRVYSNSRFLFDLHSMRHEVWDFVKHEKYNNPYVFSNDIAIIIIHDTFKFGPTVQKALLCNTSSWMSEKERSFIASGWGETKYGNKISAEGLLKTHLRYISPRKCVKMSNVSLSGDMFCLFGDGKRDACRGDSGGAILWKGMIVGIISHGEGCALTPSMYTNVYSFRSWIQTAVNRLHSKYCHFHHDMYHDHNSHTTR